MKMIPLEAYLILSIVLFGLGVYRYDSAQEYGNSAYELGAGSICW